MRGLITQILLLLIISITCHTYEYNVCIFTRIRNLAYQFPQWLEYHRLLGVDKFFIANDCSNDNHTLTQFSRMYHRLNYTIYYDDLYPCNRTEHRPQGLLLVTLLANYTKDLCKYSGIIDVDEYIVFDDLKNPEYSLTELSKLLPNALDKMLDGEMPQHLAFRLPWFDVSSHKREKRPEGLMIEGYSEGQIDIPLHVKSFTASKYYSWWESPHFPYIDEFYYKILPKQFNQSYSPYYTPEEAIYFPSTVNQSKLCFKSSHNWYLRHYYLKSWEEFYQQRVASKYMASGASSPWAIDSRKTWEDISAFDDPECPNYGLQFVKMMIPLVYKQFDETSNKFSRFVKRHCHFINIAAHHRKPLNKSQNYFGSTSLQDVESKIVQDIKYNLIHGISLNQICEQLRPIS